MAKNETKLDWTEIDVSTMPKALKARYDAVLATFKATRDAKDAFQSAFNAAKANGAETRAFAYRFGKLSIADNPDVAAPSAKRSAKGFNQV